MQIALVHDWLVSPTGGGEKVLEAIHSLFPAPIHTLVTNKKALKGSYFEDLAILPSFIQKLPRATRSYRNYLPLFPLAIEQFDLTGYDLIISSSHCAAKGVLTFPHQLHICYCHTPMRYAWDLTFQYLEESGLNRGFKGMLAKMFLHYLRGWDLHSSHRVDAYVANSRYVAGRIRKLYNREASVIYPPVQTDYFDLCEQKEEYYVTASRLIPYKRIDLIVEAFAQMPDKKLLVIGDGPEWNRIKGKAKKNIELLGYQPNDVLKRLLQKAKAFLFAAIEDFGILPVEAMACGTPVIGYGVGGLKETVVEGETGLFFESQTIEAIQHAVQRFEQMQFDPGVCHLRAEQFSEKTFKMQFKQFATERYHDHSTLRPL
ncbi:MAG: glycosyltransferase family 4 protein [Verrucomicrobiota bacterium]|nr:glycosyltransferase family 4 protein [Verrucomicrobiota bacterium]